MACTAVKVICNNEYKLKHSFTMKSEIKLQDEKKNIYKKL